MSKIAFKPPLPWQDRWTEPSLEQLLQPQKEQAAEVLRSFIDQACEIPGVVVGIRWYGAAWRWTIVLLAGDEAGEPMGDLAYIVPNPESPTIAVAMEPELYQGLSTKRLSKYIRDELRSAKWAYESYWTRYAPTNKSDVEALIDLIRRKHKHLSTGGESRGAK